MSLQNKKTLDKTIHIEYTQERAKKGKVKDVKLPYSFDLYCVRIFLKSKQQEILITNLPTEEAKIIKDILCNVVKFKSAIRKNRTFLRKQNSSKYSVGYKRNFLLS